jgi:uncharacterized membrane protein YccF (DUF307 family)
MSPVSLLLNILWVVLGGAWMAFGWLIAAVIMAITIVGLPWARAAFNIAAYTFFPFGFRAVSRDVHTGQEDIGTGPLGVIGNIIWLVLAGWWLALGHVITAVLLAVTIVGIPFAWAISAAGIALADRQDDRSASGMIFPNRHRAPGRGGQTLRPSLVKAPRGNQRDSHQANPQNARGSISSSSKVVNRARFDGAAAETTLILAKTGRIDRDLAVADPGPIG